VGGHIYVNRNTSFCTIHRKSITFVYKYNWFNTHLYKRSDVYENNTGIGNLPDCSGNHIFTSPTRTAPVIFSQNPIDIKLENASFSESQIGFDGRNYRLEHLIVSSRDIFQMKAHGSVSARKLGR
jgi:hypothetical protein